ncbi:hypothetical protein AB0K35_14565 [Micromonospora sp. NPDC053740]|uniref:hypothetical protein n=1 Tax=Micromonospora TaxID=1873 RepID=UPI001EE7CE9B|nr:hypothetical protein [Micromonospora alfalfae]MCG5460481.1 hypothetical protein [Micromonospora alfalfae]
MSAGRWGGVPLAVRCVVAVAVLVFAYGTAVHVVQLLLPQFGPQLALPGWLTFYFTSLTVWDPLAALLLAARRVQGLVLGCAVLVTDAAANGYANYVLDPAAGVTPGRIGQAVITGLAVGLVALSPWLAPWFVGSRSRSGRPVQTRRRSWARARSSAQGDP